MDLGVNNYCPGYGRCTYHIPCCVLAGIDVTQWAGEGRDLASDSTFCNFEVAAVAYGKWSNELCIM